MKGTRMGRLKKEVCYLKVNLCDMFIGDDERSADGVRHRDV